MQDKARLGKRYTCFKCGCKFYDLNKPEPVCPRCGVDQNEDPTPDPRVAVMARYKGARTAPKATASYDDADDFDLDEEEDEDLGVDEDEEEEMVDED